MPDSGFCLLDNVALVLAPLEAGAPRSGTREGPDRILRELFGTTKEKITISGVHDLQRTLWSPLTVEALHRSLLTLDDALEGRRPLFLGGCHALTFHTVSFMATRIKDLILVVLDAHSDASPRQGLEVTHGSYLSHLKHLTGVDVIHLGGRYDPHRLPQVADVFLTAQAVRGAAPGDVGRMLRARTQGRSVYLSVDVDAFDPDLIPAVQFPCVDGLRRDHMVEIVSALAGRIVAADIVEFAPGEDRDGVSAREIAELISNVQEAFALSPAPARPQRTPARRALSMDDIDALLRRYYRRSLNDLSRAYGLTAGSSILPNSPLTRTVCTARRPNWLLDAKWDGAVVVGGPCTYSMREPRNLTFRELLEIAAVVAAAKVLGLPAVVYVDDAFGWASPPIKEGAPAGDTGVSDQIILIRTLKQFCRDLVDAVADSYGLDSHLVSVAWLSELRGHDLFRERSGEMRASLGAQADRHLFRLDRRAASRPNPDWPFLVDGWAETLATYMPDVVAIASGRRTRGIMAVENLDQAKAVQTAADWWRDRTGDDAIGYLAHLPPPALSGYPMQRLPDYERFHPLDSYDAIITGLNQAPAYVRRFYAYGLPSVGAAVDTEPLGRLFELLSATRRTRAAANPL